ncbi:MAG TPA: MerR family transcriptional regulator [Acidimicrobiales bacterium]|nr:MerR family transcriptional regulator [Acidimicrobiales bacterium]
MPVRLSIGDFSRMTHLSVKALRHYHDIGLLEPAHVDRFSGYRYYDTGQVARAQVIRRFRELGMPTEEVKAVLDAPDVPGRNDVIMAHLDRVHAQLEQARTTVETLRAMLRPEPVPVPVEYRVVPAVPALAVGEVVAAADAVEWWMGAFDELEAVVAETGAQRAGPSGTLFPGDFFEAEKGDLVAFVPLLHPARHGSERAHPYEVPAAELAVALHAGAFSDIDITYGRLGVHVASAAIGVDGPIREYYLKTLRDTPDETRHRIEVGWPVFQTALGGGARL